MRKSAHASRSGPFFFETPLNATSHSKKAPQQASRVVTSLAGLTATIVETSCSSALRVRGRRDSQLLLCPAPVYSRAYEGQRSCRSAAAHTEKGNGSGAVGRGSYGFSQPVGGASTRLALTRPQPMPGHPNLVTQSGQARPAAPAPPRPASPAASRPAAPASPHPFNPGVCVCARAHVRQQFQFVCACVCARGVRARVCARACACVTVACMLCTSVCRMRAGMSLTSPLGGQ